MGEHNNAMCCFFTHVEYYADFWNGIIFQGKQVIKPEELELSGGTYYEIHKMKGKKKHRTTEQRRDVLMRRKETRGIEILLGMELMDTIDYTMPIRKLLYDAQEYHRQLQKMIRQNRTEAKQLSEQGMQEGGALLGKFWNHSGEFLYGFRKEDKIPPLITIALYCGTVKYDGCNDLADMVQSKQIDAEYRKWINGYPLRVIMLRELKEELFQTGLRELIGVMKRSLDKDELLKYYTDNKKRFGELDDLAIETIGIMIGNTNLIECKQEGGGLDMCKAFEDVREEGKIEGKIEGEERYARLAKELCLRERMADIIEAASNLEYRNRLYQEFSI